MKQLRRKIDSELSVVFNRSVEGSPEDGDGVTEVAEVSGINASTRRPPGEQGARVNGGDITLSDVETAVENVVKSEQFVCADERE